MDVRLLLLVEDEPLIAMTMQDILESEGFRVVVATDGQAASQTLEDRLHELSALITDIRIGAGPDGWSIARKARDIRPDLPVLDVTGHGATDWDKHGVPGSALLEKPFAPRRVLAEVKGMLS